MNKLDIIIGFVLRSLVWGVVLGAIVGVLFQLAFLGPVTYGVFGIILGFVVGALLGTANGIILAVFTLQFPNPLNNIEMYKSALTKTAVGSTLVGSAVLFFIIIRFLTNSTVFALFISLAASIFASLSAFYACQKVSGWYINLLSSSQGS